LSLRRRSIGLLRAVSLDHRYDLVLLEIPKTLVRAAVFPRSVPASANDMVFVCTDDALAGSRTGGDDPRPWLIRSLR
jgi:hypothetical protein